MLHILKKDKVVVLEAVKQWGTALQYVDDSLKKDKGVVLAGLTIMGQPTATAGIT